MPLSTVEPRELDGDLGVGDRVGLRADRRGRGPRRSSGGGGRGARLAARTVMVRARRMTP